MLKNVTNFHLFIVLVALLGLYTLKKLNSGPQRSKGFTAQFVNIDTTAVTSISIKDEGTTFSIQKEGSDWKINTADDKIYTAQASKVKSALTELMNLKAARVASRKEEKWADFQVDSSGLNVQVFEGDKNSLDLIIGRFGVKNMQARQFQTYVRLSEQPEVFVCENFFGASFPSKVEDFRDNRLTRLEKDQINNIAFNYPADSSFTLNKQDAKWFIQDTEVDSASVAGYLNKIWNATSRSFDNEAINNSNPLYTLTIGTESEQVAINAFQNGDKWLLNSSQNPEAYFADTTLLRNIFIGKSKLIKEDF